MKNYKKIFILILIFFSFGLNAQNSKINKADKSYEVYSYQECIAEYEGVSDKTFDIKKKLAESYYKTGNYTKSEEYYREVANSENATSEDIYNYASVLSTNKKYKESNIWMNKFANLEKDDSRAKEYLKNKGYYNELLKDNAQFNIANIDINTKNQDFGTAYYLDKVVFASSRTSAKIFKRVWNWNELPFLDLFIADNNNGKLSNIKQFKKRFKGKYHEGPASYTKNGDYTAFTRNNYDGKSKDDIIKLQIFTSEKKDGKWGDAIPVHFNNNEYSVGHPSLTADGTKMYFASDMPGGFGGVDIWVVDRLGNGKWGIPKNLGNVVNTEGNEMFPFIHENGILFYSSNGLLGLGGLDVFYTKLDGDNYLPPKNIGVPINSSFDDFALVFNNKMNAGFFSSNREEGKGDDDIYSFKLLKDLKFDIILKGKTVDENNNILAKTKVTLFNEDGKEIKSVNTNENGEYSFIVNDKANYKVIAEKTNFNSVEENFNIAAEDNEPKLLILEKLSAYNLLCKIKDKENDLPLSDIKVTYLDSKTGISKIINTKDKSDFLIKLFDFKLKDSLDYTFTFEKEGYATKSTTLKDIISESGMYEYNVDMQKVEIGEDLGKIIEIKPIYFDLDKSFIRPDAKVELDKIVAIMNEFPNMVIELSSHTDCRATSIYNLKLSDRRAKESANYIKKRINKPTRISGEGFGETKLVNDCGCESNKGKGIDCSEEQHQANRRTEFKIIRK